MVRTKADSSCVKAVGAKALRKMTSSSAVASNGDKGKQGAGGNPYFSRETPSWQKEITSFFKPTAVDSVKTFEPASNDNNGEMSMDCQDDLSIKDASKG